MAERKMPSRELHKENEENLTIGAVAIGIGVNREMNKRDPQSNMPKNNRRVSGGSASQGIIRQTPGKIKSFTAYLTDPDKDPIAKITALTDEYAVNYSALSEIDKSVRGIFSVTKSIIKGTVKIGRWIGTNIALREGKLARDLYVKAEETLLGDTGRGSAEIFNYVDSAISEAITDYDKVRKKVVSTLGLGARGGDFQDPLLMYTEEDLYIEGVRHGIKSAKEKVMKMLGFNLAIKNMLEKGIQLDIETGGTQKDSPILQIGMARMGKLNEIKSFTESIAELIKGHVDTTAIDKMSAEQQMEKGFLSLQLIPEAILRDTSTSLDPNTPKETQYKAFSYIPRSLEEFKEMFSEWATNKEGYRIEEFYKEMADLPGGMISEAKIAEIQQKLKTQGYVELRNGVKFYSQRSGALYTSLMLKRAADEAGTLFSANMTFESFRIGKLLNYFFKNDQADALNKDPFTLAMYPDLVDYISSDVDEALENKEGRSQQLVDAEVELLERFGGQIRGQTDFREGLLQASWRKHSKLNILDMNNYYYVNAVNKLRAKGEMPELIKLFPLAMERIGQGLATFDQLDFNKMLYSGLMQTGFIPLENDIFSGSKIDWQSQSMLGLKELHLALDDSVKQGQLLMEASLPKTVGNLYNIYKAMESGQIQDHVRSAFSMMSVLFDPNQKAWFDFAKVFRDTKVTVTDNITGITYGEIAGRGGAIDALTGEAIEEGQGALSATEAIKRRNIDRELLRIHETVLGILGDEDSLFYEGDVANQQGRLLAPEKGMVFEFGPNGPIRIAPGEEILDPSKVYYHAGEGIEPFNLGELVGMSRHEMRRNNGTSLFVSYRQHEYKLKEMILNRRQELLDSGHTEQSANQQILEEVVGKYAETESISGRGIDQSNLTSRLNDLLRGFSGDVQRREAIKQLFGASKVGPGMGMSFDESLMAQLKDPMNAVKRTIETGGGFDVTRFKPIFNSLKSFAKFRTGDNSPSLKQQVQQKISKIGDIKIESIKGSPKRFLEIGFGLDSAMGDYVAKHAGRAFAAMGGIGAVALGVGVGYMSDTSEWKMTTGEILKMTGAERKIEEHSPAERGGNVSLVTQQFTGPVRAANEAGVALQAIDSSKVDYAVGDGDTLDLISKGFFGLGKKKIGSVRIAGMDAPETAHGGGTGPGLMPSAHLAKNYLTNALSARTGAMVAIGGRQTYGRNMGLVIDTEGTNYSYEMVGQGLASVLYREKPEEDLIDQTAYNAAENVAKRTQSGMWANPYYYGAQSGIAGADRTGWNKMTPANIRKFGFDRSLGTTEEQFQNLQDVENLSNLSILDNSRSGPSSAYLEKKALMADMQITALANSMERNRGRARGRR